MAKCILWLQSNLRLHNNPALYRASQEGNIIPIFILDHQRQRNLGQASKWWLKESLKDLQEKGLPLIIREGNPLEVLQQILSETGAHKIFWNREYGPGDMEEEQKLTQALPAEVCPGNLLFEPWSIESKQGKPFKIFTPFWKACLERGISHTAPEAPPTFAKESLESLPIESLFPELGLWSKKLFDHWCPGEEGAHQALTLFLKEKLPYYEKGRDFPGQDLTSRLSPHLRFGEISVHHIWERTLSLYSPDDPNVVRFLAELGWREFSHHLLWQKPTLSTKPFYEQFEVFPWQDNEDLFEAWKKGQTGFPIIDAGMRELWETGYMHNRVRMLVASFLTKNVLIPWQEGESWFWDTLVDADPANNAASWQWVAGCGADASPYFRVFNPITQGERFDPQGTYIRRWLPELSDTPHIHTPWLGKSLLSPSNYPDPILDLKTTRERALAAYQAMRSGRMKVI